MTERDCHVEHLVADPPSNIQQEFLGSFPSQGRYLIRRIEGRGYVYLLEPPGRDNNMIAKIFLDDPLPSSEVHRLELCVIPER